MPRVSIQRRKELAPTVGRELELTMRLRNNCLRSRRTELGLTMDQFCRQARVSKNEYSALETLRKSPLRSPRNPEFLRDPWRPIARRVARFFRCPPDDLWPEAVIAVKNPVLTTELAGEKAIALARYASGIELPRSPERLLVEAETGGQLRELMLNVLSPLERFAVTQRFGLDETEQTYRQIGRRYNLSGSRISQLAQRALDKLRWKIERTVSANGESPWGELAEGRIVQRRVAKARVEELSWEPKPKPEELHYPKATVSTAGSAPELPSYTAVFTEGASVVWRSIPARTSATTIVASIFLRPGEERLVVTVEVRVHGETVLVDGEHLFAVRRVVVSADHMTRIARILWVRGWTQWNLWVEIGETPTGRETVETPDGLPVVHLNLVKVKR